MVDKPRSVYTDRYGPSQTSPSNPSKSNPDYIDIETGGEEYWSEDEVQGEASATSGELDELQGKHHGAGPQETNVDGDLEEWLGEHQKKAQETQETDGENDETENSTEYTVKKGIRYYDSKDPEKGQGYDFELSPTGEKVTSVVETEGSVTINLPKNSDAKISSSGNMLIVEFKNETIKVNLNKAAGVHFVGGSVSGDVDNEDKKITTDQGPFISEGEIEKLKSIIDGIPDKIGATEAVKPKETEDTKPKLPHFGTSGQTGFGGSPGPFSATDPYSSAPFSPGGASMGITVQNPDGATYVFGRKVGFISQSELDDGQKQVAKVKEVFQAMSEALGEKDPKKRKELWEDAADLIKDYMTQDKDGGHANNVAHMIGGVLMDELGGKKELIQV
ncbi:MAG: hypothetical protein K8R69_03760, partial [Deltaproteobacteria bacterium]|nr:hypothetical protein [Deltaproteobacteria bacterium]